MKSQIAPLLVCVAASLPSSGFSQPAPQPQASASQPGEDGPKLPRFGLGVKISPLGAGVEAATAVTRRSNVRVGFNDFSYSDTFAKDGINYGGNLTLRSLETHFDWFFWHSFRLSPGLLAYNCNSGSASVSVSGQQSFSLGDATYYSSPSDPITGTAKLTLNKVTPMATVGWGNLLPRGRKHFSLSVDLGAAFQGSPKVALHLLGSTCNSQGFNCQAISANPAIQSSIQSEQDKVNKSLKPFKYYPVISLAFGYKF